MRMNDFSPQAGDLTLKCLGGEWLEPTLAEVQTCAYPLRPKNVIKAGDPEPGPEQERVLPVMPALQVSKSVKKGSNVDVAKYDPYNLDQLWSYDPNGLIRSA